MPYFRKLIRLYRDAYQGLPWEIWALALVVLASRAGAMVMPFMAIYLTTKLAMPLDESGRILALFGIGATLGGFVGGWLANRFSSIKVQALTLGLEGAGLIWLLRVTTPFEIGAALFFLGLLTQAFRPANYTEVANRCPEQIRPRAIALIRLAVNVGMSIGPAIGGFLVGIGFKWLFIVDAMTCFLAVGLLVACFGWPTQESLSPKASQSPSASLFSVTSDRLFLAMLLFFGVGLVAFFQIENTFMVFLKTVYQLREYQLGTLFTINTILIITLEMLLTKFVEKKNKLIVIGVGCFFVCVGFGLLPFGSSYWVAMISISIVTLGEMLCLPMAAAWVANRAPIAKLGLYMGYYSALFGGALALAPFLGLKAMAYYRETMWYYIAILGFFLLLIFVWLERCHSPIGPKRYGS